MAGRNLISENAGEISGYYLPGTVFRDDAWLFAEKSYYFLQRREKIVVPPEAAREVRRLTDAEAADVAGTVRRLRRYAPNPWRRAGPRRINEDGRRAPPPGAVNCRRDASKLFTLAAGVSAVLCVGVCVLWVRSYWRQDFILLRGDAGRGGSLLERGLG